jgi:hypothetical protein
MERRRKVTKSILCGMVLALLPFLAAKQFQAGQRNFAPLSRGPIAYYKLCGDTSSSSGCVPSASTTVYDSGSGGHNGTWSGTQSGTSDWYSAGSAQPYAGAFDGSTDSISTAPGISPPEMTVVAWVKASAFANAYNSVFSNEDSAGGATLLVKSNGTLAIYLSGSNQASIDYDGAGSHTLTTGQWNCLAFTYRSGGPLVGYVNGVVDDTVATTSAGLLSTSRATNIGASYFSGRLWSGEIGSVQIYSSALAPGSIAGCL